VAVAAIFLSITAQSAQTGDPILELMLHLNKSLPASEIRLRQARTEDLTSVNWVPVNMCWELSHHRLSKRGHLP